MAAIWKFSMPRLNGASTRRRAISSTPPPAAGPAAGVSCAQKILILALSFGAAVAPCAAQTPPPASFVSATLVDSGPVENYVPNVAVGDMNGDGIPDLVTAGTSNNNSGVSVLLGTGSGTFPTVTYFAGTPSYTGLKAVALGDFNGDGHLDVAVGVDTQPTSTIYIYLGDGAGHLSGPTEFAGGGVWGATHFGNLAVADLNGDGKLDLVVTEDNDSTVSVLLGNGDGTFQPAVTYSTGSGTGANWVAVADLNQDGKPDLVVALDGGGDTLGVLLGNGDGTFQAAIDTGGPFQGNGVAVADVNGDGIPDVVAINNMSLDGVTVYLGKGDGTFQSPASYYAPFANSVAIANLNGKPDLIVADLFDSSVWVLPNEGNGTFGLGTAYATDFQPQGLAVADFNKDGKLDFAVGSELGALLTIALGNGDGTFRAGVNYGLKYPGSQIFSIAAADFNGDGNLDLVQAGGVAANNATTVLLGSSHGALGASIAGPALCNSPNWVDAGDVNGDGKPDVVAALNCSPGEVAVMFGTGNGSFQPPVYYSTGETSAFTYSGTVKLADTRGDGRLDLLVCNLDGSLSVLLNNGRGVFGTADLIPAVTGAAEPILTGDFNNDGKLDLALPDFANNAVKILLGNGNGRFQAPISLTETQGVPAHPQGLAVADFNHDGNLDLAVDSNDFGIDSSLGGAVAVFLGNGNATFTDGGIYGWEVGGNGNGAGSSPGFMTVADVNGDGKLDLLVALQQTHQWNGNCCGIEDGNLGLAVLLGNGDGTFVDDGAGPFLVGTGSLGVVAGDFNDDGAIDAAVLQNNPGPCCSAYVTLLINNTQPVSVSPVSIKFPARVENTESPASTVILTNNESTNLAIHSVAMGGADPGDFPYKSTCKVRLSTGADCTIDVYFKPTATGSATATLTIVDGAGTQTVALSGTAVK
jgi:hypothetical protein